MAVTFWHYCPAFWIDVCLNYTVLGPDYKTLVILACYDHMASLLP